MPAVEARLVEKLVADRIIRLGRLESPEGRQDLKKLLNICLAFVEQNIHYGSCVLIITIQYLSRPSLSTTKKRDSDVFSRHRSSDVLSQRRQSDAFSGSTFAGSDAVLNDVLSASINDLSGKIHDMKETQIEQQVYSTTCFLSF
jgi:hypothetical protein